MKKTVKTFLRGMIRLKGGLVLIRIRVADKVWPRKTDIDFVKKLEKKL